MPLGVVFLAVSALTPIGGVSSDAAVATTTTSCDSLATELQTLGLTATSYTAANNGFSYTVWSGHLPSWDGVPLQVYLTVPPAATCPLPLVSWNNGYGADAANDLAPTDAGHWNNVWFAEQGYATLGFTQRGFDLSCGPSDSSNGTVSGLPVACTENGRHYWMTLDDLRYNTRDLQRLIGTLVDAGMVDPSRVAISGASMGGGLAWEMAVLNDRTVCGGYGDPSNGPDPCAGKSAGSVVPWTSPAGTPLHVVAAVPEFGWFSLGGALLSNGRASDGLGGAPSANPYLQDQSPVGVPVQSWINTLYSMGAHYAFFGPPGADLTADWANWFPDLEAQVNTQTTGSGTSLGSAMATIVFQLDAAKSAGSYYVNFDADVPVVALQGLDDSLMSPVQAQLLYKEAKSFDPNYPISVVWGDAGHVPATNPQDLLNNFAAQANALVSTAFGRGGPAASSIESAYLVRCGSNSTNTLTEVSSGSLAGMETGSFTFSSGQAAQTTNLAAGAESSSLNPQAWSSCPTMPVQQDTGVAAWAWPVTSSGVVLGAPVITVKVHSTGADAQLDARLWVESSGTQTLVSTGPYRFVSTPGTTDAIVSYEIPATAWILRAGQTLKLEITGDDAPSYEADSVNATTTIDSVTLRLPTTDLTAFGSGYRLTVASKAPFNGTVANFVGASTNLAGNYQANINWGDGTTSTGTVAYAGYGWYVVNGSHKWAAPGSYPVSITLANIDRITVTLHGSETAS